jgi:VWFA-related protein
MGDRLTSSRGLWSMCLLVTAGAWLVAAQAAGPQGQPTFRTGVDLVRLDVTVVASNGAPVDSLDAGDFDVRVNGKPAPVRTLRFLDLHTGPIGVPAGTSLAASREYSSNDAAIVGRLFVIAVDQDSFPAGSVRTMLASAGRLLQGLGSADRVALVTLPPPGPRVDFTADTRSVLHAMSRITGRSTSRLRTYRISFDEAIQMERRNPLVTSAVLERECSFRTRRTSCLEEVVTEARMRVLEGRDRMQTTLFALSGLAQSLGTIEGPKTLVFITAGLGFEDSALSRFQEVARRAANARLQCYFIDADTFMFDVSEAAQSAAQMMGRDQEGLNTLTGLTGGVLFKGVGTATGVFERIERETRGAYVLGVELPAGIGRADALQIDVRVKPKGVTVRTPRQVVPTPKLERTADARRAIGLTLRQPRPATALPLRVSTYTVRGTDERRLKVIVSAQVPGAGVQASELAWGIEVLDGERVTADSFSDRAAADAPAAKTDTIVTAIEVPPGRYTMRFAVVDAAGRRGSVEHPLAVGLRDAGSVQLSDLLVGVEHGDAFEPHAELQATPAPIRLILEMYGNDVAQLDGAAVEFALTAPDGTSRAVTRVAAAETDSALRRVAQASLTFPAVPPGTYTAAATVLVNRRPVGRVTRAIAVGPPAGL